MSKTRRSGKRPDEQPSRRSQPTRPPRQGSVSPEKAPAQRRAAQQPAQNQSPASKKSRTAEGAGIRRRPLVDLCERSGWIVQHLNRPPAAGEELVDLCVRELIACREAGELVLTIQLADAALGAGLRHPRITANRERALRAQKREGQPSSRPSGKGATSRGLRSRLLKFFTPGRRPGPVQDKVKTDLRPAPTSATTSKVDVPSSSVQLRALRRVCGDADWSPEFLKESAVSDLELACAKEMQRCRLAGRHALVVALAAEAALQGLVHKRIQDNLERSKEKAQLESFRVMLKSDQVALVEAERLLLEALIDTHGNREYRQLAADVIGRQLAQQGDSVMSSELRQASVDLELNQRLLKAIERRHSNGADT